MRTAGQGRRAWFRVRGRLGWAAVLVGRFGVTETKGWGEVRVTLSDFPFTKTTALSPLSYDLRIVTLYRLITILY